MFETEGPGRPRAASFKLPKDRPCPTCYAPMIQGPGDVYACPRHGDPAAARPAVNGRAALDAMDNGEPQHSAGTDAASGALGGPVSQAEVTKLGRRAAYAFGTWADAVEAAGYDRPARGGARRMAEPPPAAKRKPRRRPRAITKDKRLDQLLATLPLTIQAALFNNALRDARRQGHELANMLDDHDQPDEAARVRAQIAGIA